MRFVLILLLIGCGGGNSALGKKFHGTCTTESAVAEILTDKLEPNDSEWKGAQGAYESFSTVAQIAGDGMPEDVDLVLRHCIDPEGCSTGTTDYETDQTNLLLHLNGIERLQAWPMFDTQAGTLEGACFYLSESGDLLLERG